MGGKRNISIYSVLSRSHFFIACITPASIFTNSQWYAFTRCQEQWKRGWICPRAVLSVQYSQIWHE